MAERIAALQDTLRGEAAGNEQVQEELAELRAAAAEREAAARRKHARKCCDVTRVAEEQLNCARSGTMVRSGHVVLRPGEGPDGRGFGELMHFDHADAAPVTARYRHQPSYITEQAENYRCGAPGYSLMSTDDPRMRGTAAQIAGGLFRTETYGAKGIGFTGYHTQHGDYKERMMMRKHHIPYPTTDSSHSSRSSVSRSSSSFSSSTIFGNTAATAVEAAEAEAEVGATGGGIENNSSYDNTAMGTRTSKTSKGRAKSIPEHKWKLVGGSMRFVYPPPQEPQQADAAEEEEGGGGRGGGGGSMNGWVNRSLRETNPALVGIGSTSINFAKRNLGAAARGQPPTQDLDMRRPGAAAERSVIANFCDAAPTEEEQARMHARAGSRLLSVEPMSLVPEPRPLFPHSPGVNRQPQGDITSGSMGMG